MVGDNCGCELCNRMDGTGAVAYRFEMGDLDEPCRDLHGHPATVYLQNPGRIEDELRELLERFHWINDRLIERAWVCVDNDGDDASVIIRDVGDEGRDVVAKLTRITAPDMADDDVDQLEMGW